MSLTSNNLQFRQVINQVVNDPQYKLVSSVPLVSVHQVLLIIFACLGVLGGMALHLYANVPLWVVYPMIIFGGYMAFTPLHDATHRAVSSNNFLNDLLGTLSGSLLFPMSNTVGYRYLHLAHHRYVGDDDFDPDEAMVSIPTKYYPFGYLILLFPDFLWAYWILFKAWKRVPSQTRVNLLIMIFGNVLFHVAWLLSPLGYEYFIIFFIPNRLGIAYTAYYFAHKPHPEGVKWNEHPFHTTYRLTGNKFFLPSLLGQDHHVMHHFLPHIPWYKYHQVWDLANGAFYKEDIPHKEIFSKPEFNFVEKYILSKSNAKDEIKAKITSIVNVAKHIKLFTFEPTNETENFKAFTAGSHITITLPSEKKRSYSCLNPPYETNKYQIAVKLEPNGKGGSKEMHEAIQLGDILEISQPKNNFVLYENVEKYILIAGGIGLTPLLSMAHRLTELDKHFELHVCAKSLEEIPFQYELKNWTFAPNVEIHLDKNGKSSFDIKRTLSSPNSDTLLYVCGPVGFNKWVQETALSLGWNKDQVKQEFFATANAEILETNEFELVLEKSKQRIKVGKDETIIDALHLNNIKVPYSCLQGTCGTCICNVVDGDVDHRDAVLSEDEKIEQGKICLCVSRAKGDSLTIDL